MTKFEARWARTVLRAFAPAEGPGLLVDRAEADYSGSVVRVLKQVTPLARLGVRAAIWLVALAPLWSWGKLATITSLPDARRAVLLDELLVHKSSVVRELTLLLKFVASIALLGTASVRARSGFDKARTALRNSLPVLQGRRRP